jgi:hypothetical protein
MGSLEKDFQGLMKFDEIPKKHMCPSQKKAVKSSMQPSSRDGQQLGFEQSYVTSPWPTDSTAERSQGFSIWIDPLHCLKVANTAVTDFSLLTTQENGATTR